MDSLETMDSDSLNFFSYHASSGRQKRAESVMTPRSSSSSSQIDSLTPRSIISFDMDSVRSSSRMYRQSPLVLNSSRLDESENQGRKTSSLLESPLSECALAVSFLYIAWHDAYKFEYDRSLDSAVVQMHSFYLCIRICSA